MTLGFFAIFYPVFGAIVFLVYTVLQLDIIYVAAATVKLTSLIWPPVFTLLRVIILQVHCQWLLLNVRASLFIGTSTSIALFRLLAAIKLNSKLAMSQENLVKKFNAYNELAIALTLVSEMANTIFGLTLTLAYIMICAGFCAMVFCVRTSRWIGFSVLGVNLVFILGTVLFIFKIGSFLYETSTCILFNWSTGLRLQNQRPLLLIQKYVKSLQQLSLKAGNVSVVTVELNKGYFNSLLQNTLNLLLILKQYW